MKVISLPLALQTAIIAVVFAAAGRAAGTDTAAISEGELQAKIQYCTYCHQPSGQGYLGASPIPRLAGQQTEYFKNQLQAFIDRRRVNVFMFKVAHSLNPEMLTALATHFRDLNPKPLGGAPTELVAAGKKIFEEGVADANVPPCATCHGPEAKGNGHISSFSRSARSLHHKGIGEFGQRAGSGGAGKSRHISHHETDRARLTKSQIAAVAAYLSSLE